MKVTPIKRISISEQISQQIKEQIISGELKPGDKLPSEHELCRMYQVSRTSVRQALANLSSLDLIETRFGDGSHVKEPGSSVVMTPLISHTYLSEKSILELIELRQIMEPNVAYLACEKASKEDVERLKQIYRQMMEKQDDLKAFGRLDCDFHSEIALISQNSYLLKIYEIIADVLLNAFADIVSKRGNEAGLKYHKQIVEAFATGDAARARDVMNEHMTDLRQAYCK